MADRVVRTISDTSLIRWLDQARERVVLAAPAVSKAIATAMARRFAEPHAPAFTVVLDADPEIYRLGYGDAVGLRTLLDAAAAFHVPVRYESGLRIGLLVVDDTTVVFAPTPLLVEAGVSNQHRPNAVVIQGAEAARVAGAVDDRSEAQELGAKTLSPAEAERIQTDLAANPPKPFDLQRAVRVFSSKAQYVELNVENCRFASRQLKLPQELLDVTDEALKTRISAKVKLFEDGLGRVSFPYRKEDGTTIAKLSDDRWIAKERSCIESFFTVSISRYGRIILSHRVAHFDSEVARFEANIRSFRDAVMATIHERKAELVSRLVSEYEPRWNRNPPRRLRQWFVPTPEVIRTELVRIATDAVDKSVDFAEPKTHVIYKAITAESASDDEFTEQLRNAFKRANAPPDVYEGLFAHYDAAPELETAAHSKV